MQEGLFHSEDFSDNLIGKGAYRVLARKYRPDKLGDLVGQEALVNILTGAIKAGRVPHAMIMTGIRGIGKTTTARIIARVLNCAEVIKGNSEIIEPCGKCISCVSISESRHQDIIEMDAASNTSVNDIRVIIENALYKPVMAKYRVYIIDEVHMLSTSAFNALLKILEEPPEHLKFIFATTEIRKIPITILSRCQRFDLKRLSVGALSEHYLNIAQKEQVDLEKKAAEMIARAADGSVRDGLSILDQAISLSESKVTEKSVSEMLSLGNKEKVIQIFDLLIQGKIADVLKVARDMYQVGEEPLVILQDMLQVIHTITKIKVSGDAKANSEFSDLGSEQISKFKDLTIPFLSRSWQIIAKGIEELKFSDQQFPCLEMILIRISYCNTLPSPEELLKKIEKGELKGKEEKEENSEGKKKLKIKPNISSTEQLFDFLFKNNELTLYNMLHNDLAIVEFRDKYLKINPLNSSQKEISSLQKKLSVLTGEEWVIEKVENLGTSFAELEKIELNRLQEEAMNHEITQSVLNTFIGSKVVEVKTK